MKDPSGDALVLLIMISLKVGIHRATALTYLHTLIHLIYWTPMFGSNESFGPLARSATPNRILRYLILTQEIR